MTNREFSDEFDVLLNSYSNTAVGTTPLDLKLDEYEKSVYLTLAQEDTALSIYAGRNANNTSFEETEEVRRYLSNLITEAELSLITNSSQTPIGIEGSNSYFFSLPENPPVWFITYEAVNISNAECEGNAVMQVVPVTQDEYHKLRKNPFRGANDRRALRLDLSEGVIEIVSKKPIGSYYLRYLRKPNPILLVDLRGENLSIEGKTEEMPCELSEALHRSILEKAVMLALQTRRINSGKSAANEK